MLNDTYLSLAVASAARLGKHISPKNDTVTFSLTKNSLPANIETGEAEPSNLDVAKLIGEVSGFQDVTESSDHSTMLANSINNLTLVARDRHTRMRECIRIANNFGISQESAIRINDVGLYDIVTFELPTIMSNADFVSLYEEVEYNSGVMVNWFPGMPDLTTEQLTEILKTNTRFDDAIANFLKDFSEDLVLEVYEKYLKTQSGISGFNASSGKGNLIVDLDLSYEYALLFLLCNSLEVNIPEDISMGGNEYRSMLNTVRGACSQVFKMLISKIESADTKGILVDRYDAKEQKVVVFSSSYEKFVSKGGTPEVLQAIPTLGMVSLKTVDDVIASKGSIEVNFKKNHAKIEKARIRSIRDQMITAVCRRGKEIYTSLDRDKLLIKDSFDICCSRAVEAIEALKDSEIDTDIRIILAQALIIGFWPNSKYLEYMNSVNEFHELYPTEDVRKLEYRATIRWIVSEIVRTID